MDVRSSTHPASPPVRGGEMGPIWRFLAVVGGFGIAAAGWTLVMTAILSFIGLPLFVFGLALMQSAERR